MKKIISVLAIPIFLAGCATDGIFKQTSFVSAGCGQVSGYTVTWVRYGDGLVSVIPLSHIRRDTEWRFYLTPVNGRGGSTAYGASTVTIDGKAPGTMVLTGGSPTLVPYVPPGPDGWLFASGDYNSATVDARGRRYISLCVPATVVRNQEWHYGISIQHVGEVDPRGHVER